MEKHLSEIYSRSQKELEKKTKKFWDDFERKDIAKKKKLDAGEITETDYKKWRQGQLMTGKHWDEMTKSVAEEMVNADKTAAAYVNGKLPEIYSLNYNALADQTAGIKGYSFELVNADAVKHLATTDKSLLPYKKVNGENVVRWNTQKVNSEVLQGIIQGESAQKIAKRLSNVVGMEKNSAIRNARTTTTGAENRGRLDSYKEAQKQGLVLKKKWISTHDLKTRDWHKELDNIEVDVDEPFENHLADGSVDHIMYPGDPDADPSNVYNCRCAMVTDIKGFVSPETGELIEVGEEAEIDQEEERFETNAHGYNIGETVQMFDEDGNSFDVYVSREKNVSFPGGRKDSVKKVADADVYTVNGKRVIYAADNDMKKQDLPPDVLLRKIHEVPEAFANNMQKEIYVVDYRNPMDEYWEKTYKIKGFRSYATGGDEITFYAKTDHDYDFVTHTLYHEGAHFVDQTNGYVSKQNRWIKAAKLDEDVSGEKAVSVYAKRALRGSGNYTEDFADSMAMYIENYDRLAEKFPNRTAEIERLIGGW